MLESRTSLIHPVWKVSLHVDSEEGGINNSGYRETTSSAVLTDRLRQISAGKNFDMCLSLLCSSMKQSLTLRHSNFVSSFDGLI